MNKRRLKSGFRRKPWLPTGVAAAALLAGVGAAALAALSWWAAPGYGCFEVENYSDELLLKVDPLARGAEQKYCWTMPDRPQIIRFIVARRSDGAIKVVLDACQACYLNRLGYRLTKGALVCRFCGNRYSVDNLSLGIMSCRPLKLPFRLDRGLLKIRTSDLEASSAFFPPQSDIHEMLLSALRRVVALSRRSGADAWWCRSNHTNRGADHMRQLL
jgi:Membrane iron-sulfur containing protein FtrD-like